MIPNLSFNDRTIGQDEDGMWWSLTDMWKAAGSPKLQKPSDWIRQADVQAFISAVEQQYHKDLAADARRNRNAKSTLMFPSAIRRSTGGIFGYWQIALAFAKYLSPKFHIWCNSVVRRYLDADPEMVEDMFTRMPLPDQRWTIERLRGIEERHKYTDVLKQQGVSGAGYGRCTEALQSPILKMPTSAAKAVRGISKNRSIREVMTTAELATTRFAEQAATARITHRNVRGDRGCILESGRAGKIAAAAFDKIVNGD